MSDSGLPVVADAGRTETAAQEAARLRAAAKEFLSPLTGDVDFRILLRPHLAAMAEAVESAALRLERAEQEQREATAWLIEVHPRQYIEGREAPPDGRDATLQFVAVRPGGWWLTSIADEAVRFARRADAEAVRRAVFSSRNTRYRVAEHIWADAGCALAASPAPTAEPDHG